MSEELANLLHEGIEKAGEISFELNDKKIFDKEIKDATVFYKLIGESRFKFFRNNAFELVFIHLTEDWMRQAKLDLNKLDLKSSLDVKLSWGEKEDTLSVRCPGEIDYIKVIATHIDN